MNIKILLLICIVALLGACTTIETNETINITNVINETPEELDLCAEEKRLDCELDSDCVCERDGCFVGGREYFENCINISSDHCTFNCGLIVRACINNKCTGEFPGEDWSLEDCDNKLDSERNIKLCKDKVRRNLVEQGGDVSLCEGIIADASRDRCRHVYYMQEAQKQDNVSLCDEIAPIEYAYNDHLIDNCKRYYYYSVAEKNKNPGMCGDLFEKEYEIRNCLAKAIRASKNPNFCYIYYSDIHSDSEKICYTDVAIEAKDTSICLMHQEQYGIDYCYYVLASEFEDLEMCNLINRSRYRNDCLNSSFIKFGGMDGSRNR